MKNFIKSFAVVVLSILRVWMLLIGGLVMVVGSSVVSMGKFVFWLGGGIVGFADKYAGYIKKLV